MPCWVICLESRGRLITTCSGKNILLDPTMIKHLLKPLLLQSTHFPTRVRLKSCNQNTTKERGQSLFLRLHTCQTIFMALGKENFSPRPHRLPARGPVNYMDKRQINKRKTQEYLVMSIYTTLIRTIHF